MRNPPISHRAPDRICCRVPSHIIVIRAIVSLSNMGKSTLIRLMMLGHSPSTMISHSYSPRMATATLLWIISTSNSNGAHHIPSHSRRTTAPYWSWRRSSTQNTIYRTMWIIALSFTTTDCRGTLRIYPDSLLIARHLILVKISRSKIRWILPLRNMSIISAPPWFGSTRIPQRIIPDSVRSLHIRSAIG